MERSGAQIAWDELNPGIERPWFIDDIGDRDLWTWNIQDSKNTTRAMFSLGFYGSVEKFCQVNLMDRDYHVRIGAILNEEDERQTEAIVKRAVECKVNHPKLSSYRVKIVECEHTNASDVCNRLVKDGDIDFSVAFRYDISKDEWCSARSLIGGNSRGEEIDLTKIVPIIDPTGGGHPHASGFTIRSPSNLRTYFTPVQST